MRSNVIGAVVVGLLGAIAFYTSCVAGHNMQMRSPGDRSPGDALGMFLMGAAVFFLAMTVTAVLMLVRDRPRD